MSTTAVRMRKDVLDIELKDLYAPNGKFTPEEKIRAGMAYVVTGSEKKAAAYLKKSGLIISQQLISYWKCNTTWWDNLVLECRKKKQDELDSMYTSVIHDVVEQVHDRVIKGDWKVDKYGEKFRLPMGGKDLAITMAVTFDKRQLLRGEATQRIEKTSEKDRIDALQKTFQDMSLKMKGEGHDARVINTEEIKDGK